MPQCAAILYTRDVDWTSPAEASSSTATTIRVAGGRGGEVVTSDGPYAETEEVARWLLPARVRRPRRSHQGRCADPGGVGRRRRAPPRDPDGVADPSDAITELARVEGGRILAS